MCSANLGDTDLAITTENVGDFVEYVQGIDFNDKGQYTSFILFIEYMVKNDICLVFVSIDFRQILVSFFFRARFGLS